MQIQVNSDRTVSVDASLTGFVRSETQRILATAAAKVTRVEVHLSDVNGRKSGPADKRCVVEARPAGARPLSTSATAKKLDAAIGQALRKMQRALRTFFGRHGRASTGSAVPTPRVKKAAATGASPATKPVVARAKTPPKVATAAKRIRPASKAVLAAAAAPAAEARGPKKTPIFQARRKAWPGR
jgi:Sigma 54 modulation protein / S30EA ribosomal protein